MRKRKRSRRVNQGERKDVHRGNFSSRVAPLIFIGPSLAGVFVFVIIPFLDVLRRSLMVAKGEIGIRHYVSVLQNDAFQLAAGNTIKFVLACIPLLVALSLGVAMILKGLKEKGDLYRSIFLLPMAIPAASMVLIWKLFFHQNGLINHLLIALGKEEIFFMGTDAAFWVLVGSYVWKNIGYDVVLWIGGLSKISPDIYEAASIDGAGKMQKFFLITLPNLTGVLFMIFVLSLLNSFKVFREAYLAAGQYPHTSMYLLQHLFSNWFSSLQIEKLSAGAVMTAGVIFGLIFILKKLWEEKEE